MTSDEKLASKDNSSDEAILSIAKHRFKIAQEAESQSRKDELDDLKFMVGDQWPMDIKNARMQDARPCITINRIPQYVRQVTNDQRQNRPSIKVNPVDDKADIETAKVLQGIVRHIEYASHADAAYDTAFEFAVKSGLGYFRIVTDYTDPLSFNQELKIKRIKNRFSVYVDPYYEEPDGSDISWGFIFDDIPHDEFKEAYPNSKASSMSDWRSLGENDPNWIQEHTIRVAEYYYKTYEKQTLVLLSDKTVLPKDQLPKKLPEGVKVVGERQTLIPKIKWCKINGIEILEKTDVPGRWIPIIPVHGEEHVVDGRRILSGIIRNAKDPQRLYNYWASSITETITLAPKAPFIGAEGQFEGHEAQWKTANQKNHAYLEYKPKTIGGQPAPPPQRNMVEPPIQAMSAAMMNSSEDLKATTGIYDAALGNRSNETTGVAIQRRNIQSQTSNFHFTDNLARSLRHAGRILVNWIPQVYDTPRVVRMVAEDGEVSMVSINQVFQEKGDEKSHFLDQGCYDVVIDTGPSYQTKRQEAVASLLDLARSAPQLIQVGGDLMVRNMDWQGAQELADRIKKTLPPGIAEDDKSAPQIPPQVQAQLQQMHGVIQQLTQHLDESTEIIRTKKLELESKERIAMIQAETQLKEAYLKTDAADAQLAFKLEIDQINKRLEMLNMDQPISDDDGSGQMAAQPEQQSPTGGQSPGQPMGV